VKPRVLQNGLFVPLAPAPDKLELTLARLAKLVGEENIGSPVARHASSGRVQHEALHAADDLIAERRKKRNRRFGNRQCLGFRGFVRR
jgi:hypothetical protein